MNEDNSVRSERPDLVTVIAVYRFFVAALALLGVLALTIGLVAVVFNTYGEDLLIAGVAITTILAVMLAVVALNVVIGIGLLKLQDWARWMAIVTGALSLTNVPVGTVIGGLTIWYLLTPEAKVAFGAE
jgi:hypothetical protein